MKMKTVHLFCLLGAISFTLFSKAYNKPLVPSTMFNSSEEQTKSPAEIAFEKIKSLSGTWKMTPAEPGMETISYEVISAGSAVLERSGNMVTVFHLHDDVLIATHYCEAQNQPRFIANDFSNNNVIQFHFLDITNSKKHSSYINSIRMQFIDSNHMVQHWTWLDKGVEQAVDFDLMRIQK